MRLLMQGSNVFSSTEELFESSAPWTRLGSNQEPTDYESAALTIELRVLRLT